MNFMNKAIWGFIFFGTFATSLAGAQENEPLGWPQEIQYDGGKIIIYQPQPEQLVGNILSARAAISLERDGKGDPIFGAAWFTARIDTDTDSNIATARNLEITKVAWPDSNDENEQRFTQIVESAVPPTGFSISMDRLSASLESAQVERRSLENLNTDPPKIIFSDELAVLLLYDDTPQFRDVENSDYERALNVPMLVVRNKKTNICYLSSGTLYSQANDPLGPWALTNSPPADLVEMLPKPDDDQTAPGKPPNIVTATEPAELISTDGDPEWTSLTGGKILYVSNTETAWLRELSTGDMYVLLSGRWFKSKNEQGPWTFVRPDQLPDSFKEIPPASDIGGMRVSVAGTEEAEQAMTDAAIPQTAAIKRSEATLDVQYDGSPEFENIPGTSVSYAVNTGAQVLEVDDKYYAVDNGVWFVSVKANGPWVVADSIPEDEIQKIPPESPVYNTTYVQIYDSTPEVVYVGYYPGYMWSFPYYGVPVYGTGWYYPPYWGGMYYPRPPTWGFHVGYNPWTGWNFGVSWSNGFFTMGVRWGGGWGGSYRPWGCCGGWYGGGYHRRPVVINTGNINIGNSVSIGNRTNIGNNIGSGNNGIGSNNNVYNRPENRSRKADRATVQRDMQQRPRPATDRANNVYADRNGNVARRNGDQWEARQDNGWKPEQRPESRSQPSTLDTGAARTGNQSASLDYGGLDRSYNARSLGSSREMSRSRGGAGRRRR
jgi:hypothetical protein